MLVLTTRFWLARLSPSPIVPATYSEFQNKFKNILSESILNIFSIILLCIKTFQSNANTRHRAPEEWMATEWSARMPGTGLCYLVADL